MGLVRFAVAVDVMPKEGISDPQGQAVARALPSGGRGERAAAAAASLVLPGTTPLCCGWLVVWLL